MPTSTITTQLGAINSSIQHIGTVLQNESFLNSQLFAAIVGALLGALLGLLPFLWLLYKDRPIIKVRASKAWAVYSSGAPRNVLSVSVYNHGRRPVNITQVFLLYATGESLVFPIESSFLGGSGLPLKLEEGNSHTVRIAGGTIAQSVNQRKDYPVAACYSDALGRVYKYKLSQEFWERFFKTGDAEKESHY